MDWYIFAIIAMAAYGIQNFLFKVSAEKRCNSAWTTFSFMLTVAAISSVLFFISGEGVPSVLFLVSISFFNAVTFLVTTMSRMEALKHMAASIAFPIIRMSTILVVLFSVVYFRDRLTVPQISGIVLAIIAIYILMRGDDERDRAGKGRRIGIILASVALVASALTTIAAKFAALYTDNLAFISLSYIMNTVFALGFRGRMQTTRENPDHRNAVIIGAIIGVVNLVGFYMLLKAFEMGPLSIVSTINSLYFVVAIILSMVIYKERLSWKRAFAIAISVVAVILLRG
jgi:drug/metabolite transporter (DMT)-like permease